MMPLSIMNALIAYQMSHTPKEDLEQREKEIEEEEQEVFVSLEERVQEAISTLQSLHLQLKSVSPKADMLAESSTLLKENREKLSAVLVEAKAHFQNEKEHNQRLKTRLYQLEQLYIMKQNRISSFTEEAGGRIIATIGDH